MAGMDHYKTMMEWCQRGEGRRQQTLTTYAPLPPQFSSPFPLQKESQLAASEALWMQQ